MHPDPRRILPVVGILVILGLAGYYLVWPAFSKNGELVVSGTIEATEVRLASEFGGRVDEVFVAEGDRVAADQNVVSVQPSSSARWVVARAHPHAHRGHRALPLGGAGRVCRARRAIGHRRPTSNT